MAYQRLMGSYDSFLKASPKVSCENNTAQKSVMTTDVHGLVLRNKR